jgi:hypothetical protein
MAFLHYTLKVLVNGVYRDHLLDSPQGEVRIFYEGVYLRPKRFYVPPPPTTIGRCPPGYALLRFFIPEEINPGYAKLQFWDMPCQSDFTVGTYHIEWRQFGTYSLLGAVGPLVETHYDVGDLTPDTDYEWRVWRDVWSEWTPFKTLAPPPPLLQVEWHEVGGTINVINIQEEEPTYVDVEGLTLDTDHEWRIRRELEPWSEWTPFRTLAHLLQVEWREVGGTTNVIDIQEEEPTYVDVEGLAPDTDHEWRIRGELRPWSEWFQFRTLPL